MHRNKWIIFLVLTGMYIIAYFYRVSAAVIAGDLEADLHLSSRELGNISAALFYAFAVAQLPLGPLLDRIGPRRTIAFLGLVTAVGAFVFAQATGYGGALWGRILIGAGTASVLMGSLKVYTAWFSPSRFATLSGLQVALGNLGNLLATAPLAWLAGSFGWRATFAGFGVATTAAALGVWAVVRDAPPAAPAPERAAVFGGWRQIAARPAFWALSLQAFFWYGTYMAIQGLWGGPYLMDVLGFDRAGTGRVLLMTALGFIVGCPLAGRLSDRVLGSRKKVLVPGQGGLLVLVCLFLGPLQAFPGWLIPVVFFLVGLCVSTGPVLYAQVKELFPKHLAATAMTAVNFFVVMGAALMQQGMGQVMERLGGPGQEAYQVAFALPAGGLALAWLGYLCCPDTRPG